MDGKKTFAGTLIRADSGQVTITEDGKTEITFAKEQIAKTKLKVVF
jgi:ribosome maturation factor RimP